MRSDCISLAAEGVAGAPLVLLKGLVARVGVGRGMEALGYCLVPDFLVGLVA